MENLSILLLNAPVNKDLEIKEVLSGNNLLMQHGITPGEKIKIISKYSLQPLLLEVRDSFIALDHHYAHGILVEVLS